MQKFLNVKTMINLGVFFMAGFGAARLVHLPVSWSVVAGLGAVIANQVGLHQDKPESF